MAMQFSIDLDQNSASLSIPKEIYLRILSKAVSQTKTDISEMEDALPVADFTKLQAISHRLKGDYGNMRLVGLSGLAKEMNDIAKSSQDKERFRNALNEFKNLFLQLEIFLKGQKHD